MTTANPVLDHAAAESLATYEADRCHQHDLREALWMIDARRCADFLARALAYGPLPFEEVVAAGAAAHVDVAGYWHMYAERLSRAESDGGDAVLVLDCDGMQRLRELSPYTHRPPDRKDRHAPPPTT